MFRVDKIKDWQIIGLVILILLPLYLVFLGQSSMWDLDEGVYSEIAREMVIRNDYVNTFYNYEPRFDKPPLVLWITAFFYNLIGVNEFATRIGIVIFGLSNLVLLYFFTKRLFDKKTAFYSIIILGTSFQYLIQSRLIFMDVPLTFFITLSLYLFHLGYHDDRKYYVLMGLALALGTLVKGPVALGLPCLIFLVYLGVSTFFKEFKYGWTWLAVLIYFAVSLPWHYLVYYNYGIRFINDFFGYHMITRFSTAIEQHGGPWYYYLLVIPIGLFPWSAFIPWIYSAIKKSWNRYRSEFNFLIIWLGVILVFFSIASTKLPGYILPTYPIFAMLIGYWWKNLSFEDVTTKKFIISGLLIVIIGVLVLSGLLYVKPRVKKEFTDFINLFNILFAFPALFIGGGIIAIITLLSIKRPMKSLLVYFIIAYISLMLINVAVVPAVDKFKVARPLSQVVAIKDSAKYNVASFLETEPASLVFYCKHKVNYLKSFGQVKNFIETNDKFYLFLDKEDYNRLAKQNYNITLLKEYQGSVVVKNSN